MSHAPLFDPASPELPSGPPSVARRDRPAISRGTLTVLALAMIVGGYLRFAHLGGREMSADEGASWAAAAASTIHAVLEAQSSLNPGKAGLHDVALHLWMKALGQGLTAMRGLSAAIGTLAILMVFGAARELFAAAAEPNAGEGPGADQRNQAAAIAALLFAVNLVTIKYSREMRMYPIVFAAVVAQTWCFFRTIRAGRAAAWIGVAIFTALGLAAHMTAVLAFTGEGVWLTYAAARNRFDFRASPVQRASALMIALGAGVVMLAPIAPAMLSGAAHAADLGAIDWIKRPPFWAPFTMFNKATGTVAWPVMGALAAWGVFRGWHRWRDPIVFALLWMWSPPILLLIVSYAIRPAFVERYLLACFVPLFILIAIGIVELRSRYARIGAIILVVALALGHVVTWDRKPHDVQWREAVQAAAAAMPDITGKFVLVGGNMIAVAPAYAVNVVRYYLPTGPPALVAHPADASGHDPAPIVLIADQGVAPQAKLALDREYPRPLANLRGVVVRGR